MLYTNMFKYMRAQAYNNKGGVEFAKKTKTHFDNCINHTYFWHSRNFNSILVKNNNEKQQKR